MLSMVGLAGASPASTIPHQLSGGMKQRVGIAARSRNDPEVLLMDEPLVVLDAQTRAIMQEELLRIWAALGKTVVYVTHSLEEALLLGDRVVLLTARPGRVSEIYAVDLGRLRRVEVRASPAYGLLLEKIWSRLKASRRWRWTSDDEAAEHEGRLPLLAEHWITIGSPIALLLVWEWGERHRHPARGLLSASVDDRRPPARSHARRHARPPQRRSRASAGRSRSPQLSAWATGLAMGLWRRLREGLDPLFAVIYPIPSVSAARELPGSGRWRSRADRHHRDDLQALPVVTISAISPAGTRKLTSGRNSTLGIG